MRLRILLQLATVSQHGRAPGKSCAEGKGAPGERVPARYGKKCIIRAKLGAENGRAEESIICSI